MTLQGKRCFGFCVVFASIDATLGAKSVGSSLEVAASTPVDSTCGASLIESLALETGCASVAPSDASEDGVVEVSGSNGSGLDCLITRLFDAANPHPAGKSSAARPREMTYGELRPAGLESLFFGRGMLGVSASADDAFMDLGSGTGKLPVHAFLRGVRLSTGVELDEHRHKVGASALSALHSMMSASEAFHDPMRTELALDGRRISLIAGDMLQMHLSNYTAVFANSVCFPDTLLQAISAKLCAELKPGAVFWTPKQLPASKHAGLVYIGKEMMPNSWSSHSQILFYIRVPDVALPVVFTDTAAVLGGQLSKWADEVANVVQTEFEHLRDMAGQSGQKDPLAMEAFNAVSQSLGVATASSSSRLLRAFGVRGSRGGDDRCGCTAFEGETIEWSLTEADFMMMVAHGVVPSGEDAFGQEWREVCPTASTECTAGDLVFGTVRAAQHHCETMGGNVCNPPALGEPGAALARMPGLACLRSSDGRMLLHTATFRNAPDAAARLATVGDHALLCTDYEGAAVLHLVVRASRAGPGEMLAWALGAMAGAGRVGEQAFTLRDFTGRTPLGISRSAGVVRALLAAGAPRAQLDEVDTAGKLMLYRAVAAGDVHVAAALLELGANVSCTGRVDNSPLLAAARKGGSVGADLVMLLVSHRAMVDAKHGDTSFTALHIAAQTGHVDTVQALLGLGAEREQETGTGRKPRDLTRRETVLNVLNQAASGS